MTLDILARAKKHIISLLNNQKGGILIQTSMAMIVLIGILGIGVDMGRAYLYRSQLSGALDAAALAGAKSFHSATRNAEIQAFFNSNFNPTFMGGVLGPLVITDVNVVQKTLSVSTSGTLDTVFMRIFGWNNVAVSSSAETTSKQTGLQIVMVLDNTGSMRSSDAGTVRIDALKTSATTLVSSLFGSDATNPKLQIAIVPYVTTVNVGHLLSSAYVDYTSVPASYTYNATDLAKWNGCVEARPTTANLSSGAAYDVMAEHGGVDWIPFLWRPHYDNKLYNLVDLKGPNGEIWPAPSYQRPGGPGEGKYDAGPNINCPAPVLDFTSTAADLYTYINGLYYSYNRGGTIANLGMIWGWRMLHTGSPFFNPIAYDDASMVKAAILMTDGENWIIDNGGKHPYYDGNDSSKDDTDSYDDDGDTKCPSGCATLGYDPKDETVGPAAVDASNGPSIGGYYNGDYSGYGRRDEGRLDGATTRTASTTGINNRLAYVCSAMKGMGITIYTVTFGSGATNTALQNLYQGCATDSGKYYHAPSAAELSGAFEAIANDLADLRLSK